MWGVEEGWWAEVEGGWEGWRGMGGVEGWEGWWRDGVVEGWSGEKWKEWSQGEVGGGGVMGGSGGKRG